VGIEPTTSESLVRDLTTRLQTTPSKIVAEMLLSTILSILTQFNSGGKVGGRLVKPVHYYRTGSPILYSLYSVVYQLTDRCAGRWRLMLRTFISISELSVPPSTLPTISMVLSVPVLRRGNALTPGSAEIPVR